MFKKVSLQYSVVQGNLIFNLHGTVLVERVEIGVMVNQGEGLENILYPEFQPGNIKIYR